jgi:hypothetical protein
MRTSLILEKVNFLRGILDPNTVDGNPGQPGPIFRAGIAEYAVAEILRDIGKTLKDRTLATQIHNIGKELVTESSKGLLSGWEDGDDICPPYLTFPIPKPGPDPWQQIFNLTAHPEPLFDHATPALHDVVLAVAIRELASLTTHEKTSTALKQVGENIVKNASSKLYEEYCGTRVKPRIPAPTPHRTAA